MSRPTPDVGPRFGRGEVSNAGAPSGAPEAAGAAFAHDGRGVAGEGLHEGRRSLFAHYLRHVDKKVRGAMRYDRERALDGEQGYVIVHYVIERDGSLGDVKILRRSGIAEFDADAPAALRRAAPFWPIPLALGQPRLLVKATLKYNNPVVP